MVCKLICLYPFWSSSYWSTKQALIDDSQFWGRSYKIGGPLNGPLCFYTSIVWISWPYHDILNNSITRKKKLSLLFPKYFFSWFCKINLCFLRHQFPFFIELHLFFYLRKLLIFAVEKKRSGENYLNFIFFLSLLILLYFVQRLDHCVVVW